MQEVVGEEAEYNEETGATEVLYRICKTVSNSTTSSVPITESKSAPAWRYPACSASTKCHYQGKDGKLFKESGRIVREGETASKPVCSFTTSVK